jgi:uncharacterized protein YndB with AHSA1/START domain
LEQEDPMKRFETSVDIAAAPERVWKVLSDVERMPTWTPTMTSVLLEPSGDLHPGSRATITQPRLGTVTWTVTESVPNRSFSWSNGRPGLHTAAFHTIEPTASGSRVTLAIEHRGALSAPAALLTAGLTRRYLDQEAAGLKTASETRPSTSSAQP